MAPQKDSRVKPSALLRAGHKLSGVANLVVVSLTTVYAIKNRMDDDEEANRRAGSGRKTAMDRNSLQDVIRRTACGILFEGQQSINHCLHVCCHLRHRPCAS